jgi:hypothetical protein
MKLRFCFPLLFLSTFAASAQTEKLYPGMTVEEFRKVIPDIVPATFSKTITNGGWVLDFRTDTLKEIYFYQGQTLYEGFFKKDLSDYKEFFDHYTVTFGKPLFQLERTTSYQDPNERKRFHDQDTLLAAAWETRSMSIFLTYCFTGNYSVEKKDPHREQNAAPPLNYYELRIDLRKKDGTDLKLKEEEYYLGMNVHDYAKKDPLDFPGGIVSVSGGWSRPEERYGLDGSWYFTFDQDTLTGMRWDHHTNELSDISDSTFHLHLSCWKKIRHANEKNWGLPYYTTSGDTVFKPIKKGFGWGTGEFKSKWKVKGGYGLVEFYCFGGKGEYFMVTCEEYGRKERDY